MGYTKEMNDALSKPPMVFIVVIALMILVVSWSSWYIYLYTKDYAFIVETPCPEDQAMSACFVRDCSEEGSCPPNNLSVYGRWQIKASDFDKCSGQNCLEACTLKQISCQRIPCNASDGEDCMVN